MQNRMENRTPSVGRYSYQNPFEAEYYFVEGMGFLPSNPRSYERSRIRRSANFAGICLLLFLLANCWIGPVLVGNIMRFLGMGHLHSSETVYRLYQLLLRLICLALPFWAYQAMVGIPTHAAYPFRKPHSQLVGCGMCMALGAGVLGNVLSGVISRELIFFGARPYDSQSYPAMQPTSLVLYLVGFGLLLPVLEELIFRGLVLGSLRPYGDWFALLTSSVLFGVVQLNPVEFPKAFLLGLVLGYFTLISGSLWTGVILRVGVGVSQFCLIVLEQVMGYRAFPLGGYGWQIALLLCGLIGFLYYIRKAHQTAFSLKPGKTHLAEREKNTAFYTAPAMFLALVFCVAVMVGISL